GSGVVKLRVGKAVGQHGGDREGGFLSPAGNLPGRTTAGQSVGGRHHRGTEMRRRPHERDAATDRESSERDVRFGPDTVLRMRGSFREPPGNSGPRARPTTATLQFNQESSPARTGRESGKVNTARSTNPCRGRRPLTPQLSA